MLLALCTPLVGCFAAQNTAASAEYARQVTTANLRVSEMEAQLVASAMRIEQLEEFVRVQGQSAATKMENLDQVNAEVTRLRGAIEVLQFEATKIREDLEKYQIQQERRQIHDERRLTQVETMLGVTPPPPPTNAELGLGPDSLGETDPTGDPPSPTGDTTEPSDGEPTTAPPTEPTSEVPDTARGKLELAATHMAAGRQAVARAVLTRAKAEHADGKELAEIEFRIAETYFNERTYSKAALAFKRVIDDHPGSAWASWSMLRQGECFDGLGQTDNARLFWDGVIQRFPKSDAAKEAKKRLGR